MAYYGVPTVLFDICILVDDMKKAAEVLIAKGWTVPPPELKARDTDIKEATTYLVEPELSRRKPKDENAQAFFNPLDMVVALSSASDWDIALPDASSPTYSNCHRPHDRWPFIPPLHELVDSLIQRWLDAPREYLDFRHHLRMFLGYLYRYVPILKSPEFAEYLKIENRQYHFDVIAGVSVLSEPYWEHQREVRNSIRKGEYQLRECSADKSDERFFTAAAEARLLASLRSGQ